MHRDSPRSYQNVQVASLHQANINSLLFKVVCSSSQTSVDLEPRKLTIPANPDHLEKVPKPQSSKIIERFARERHSCNYKTLTILLMENRRLSQKMLDSKSTFINKSYELRRGETLSVCSTSINSKQYIKFRWDLCIPSDKVMPLYVKYWGKKSTIINCRVTK